MNKKIYTLYSRNGLVLDTFDTKAAALYAYNNWAASYTLFYGMDIIKSKR